MARNYAVLDYKDTPIWGDHTRPLVHMEERFVSLAKENGEKWHVWTPPCTYTPESTLRNFDAPKPRADLIFPLDDFWMEVYGFAEKIMTEIYNSPECFPAVPRPPTIQEFLRNATLPLTEDGNNVVVGRNLDRSGAPIPIYDQYGTEHTGTFEVQPGDTIRVQLTILAWAMAPDNYGISLRIGPYGLMVMHSRECEGPYQHMWSEHQYVLDKNKVRHPCGKDFLVDLPEGFIEKITKNKIRLRVSDSLSWFATLCALEKFETARPIVNNNCMDITYKSDAFFQEEGGALQCTVRFKKKLGSIIPELVAVKN